MEHYDFCYVVLVVWDVMVMKGLTAELAVLRMGLVRLFGDLAMESREHLTAELAVSFVEDVGMQLVECWVSLEEVATFLALFVPGIKL